MPEQRRFTWESDTLDYQLIRSPRRRTVGIEIHRDQSVRVRAPARLGQQYIDAVLRRKLAWIRAKQRQQSGRPPPPPGIVYLDGSDHWLLGRRYRLKVASGRPAMAIDDDRQLLLCSLPDPSEEAVRAALLKWYRRQALQTYTERLSWWLERIRHWPEKPTELRSRLLKRTWGTCTAGGRITINTLAIKLPLPLIDYIICHELCHLKEMNHGPLFYLLQAELLPDYALHRKQIRALEGEVLRY